MTTSKVFMMVFLALACVTIFHYAAKISESNDVSTDVMVTEPNEPLLKIETEVTDSWLKAIDDDADKTLFNLDEPNEPEGLTCTDPNMIYFSGDYALEVDFGITDTITVGNDETIIYLKNLHLLDKDELRDFALFISCATSNLNFVCDEYYEGILRLVPEKLLIEPNDKE